MTDTQTPREAIRSTIVSGLEFDPWEEGGSDPVWMDDIDNATDNVVRHIWELAMSDEIVREIAEEVFGRTDLNILELGDTQQTMATMLEAVIGPRPEEVE